VKKKVFDATNCVGCLLSILKIYKHCDGGLEVKHITVNYMIQESVIFVSNETGDEDKLEPTFDILLIEGAALSLTIQRSYEINSITA